MQNNEVTENHCTCCTPSCLHSKARAQRNKDRWAALFSWARKRKGRVIGGRELVCQMEKLEREGGPPLVVVIDQSLTEESRAELGRILERW
jgi:hypothetical protein